MAGALRARAAQLVRRLPAACWARSWNARDTKWASRPGDVRPKPDCSTSAPGSGSASRNQPLVPAPSSLFTKRSTRRPSNRDWRRTTRILAAVQKLTRVHLGVPGTAVAAAGKERVPSSWCIERPAGRSGRRCFTGGDCDPQLPICDRDASMMEYTRAILARVSTLVRSATELGVRSDGGDATLDQSFHHPPYSSSINPSLPQPPVRQ